MVRFKLLKSEKGEVGLMDAKIWKYMVGEMGSQTDVMRRETNAFDDGAMTG